MVLYLVGKQGVHLRRKGEKMARYIDADKAKKAVFWDAEAIEAIDQVPTTEVQEVRHGKWEVVDEAEPRRYGCSRCKCFSWTKDNYCSNCGADMRERRDDAEIH